MTRRGIVKRIEHAVAIVELLPMPGCAGCEKQRRAGFGPGHCGIDLLGLSGSRQRTVLHIPLPQAYEHRIQIGDEVDVQLPAADTQWLWIALQVYAIPTLGLFLGAVIGSSVGEGAAVAFAGLGLCAGLWLGRRFVHVPQSIAMLSGPVNASLRIVNIGIESRS